MSGGELFTLLYAIYESIWLGASLTVCNRGSYLYVRSSLTLDLSEILFSLQHVSFSVVIVMIWKSMQLRPFRFSYILTWNFWPQLARGFHHNICNNICTGHCHNEGSSRCGGWSQVSHFCKKNCVLVAYVIFISPVQHNLELFDCFFYSV